MGARVKQYTNALLLDWSVGGCTGAGPEQGETERQASRWEEGRGHVAKRRNADLLIKSLGDLRNDTFTHWFLSCGEERTGVLRALLAAHDAPRAATARHIVQLVQPALRPGPFLGVGTGSSGSWISCLQLRVCLVVAEGRGFTSRTGHRGEGMCTSEDLRGTRISRAT